MNHQINFYKRCKKSSISIEKISENKIKNHLIEFTKYILSDENLLSLSKSALAETGFGNVNDKIIKKKLKTSGLLEELINLNFKDKMSASNKIYKPIGVIVGITPSTNPVATSINYFMNSLRCKNSLIIIPNLRTYKTIQKFVKIVKKFLKIKKLPLHLINLPDQDLIKSENLVPFLNLSDKIIITGGGPYLQSLVSKSTTPMLSFGKGNPPIIVDNNVDIREVVKKIILSKSFDFSTSCSADSVLIVDYNIYDNIILEFKKQNSYILNSKEKTRLSNIFLKKGIINSSIVAKSPKSILNQIGINIRDNIKLIIVESNINDKKKYFLKEKITPILTIVKSKNINDSMEIAKKILNISGKGHSAGIYSKSKKNVIKAAEQLDVSRLIVNQPHSQSAGGSKNNNLPFSLSLGTGSWGGDLINRNLSYKDFLNITRIVNYK